MKKVMIFMVGIVAALALSSTALAVDATDSEVIRVTNDLLNNAYAQASVSSMDEAAEFWQIVQAYIDAISTTSETLESDALVTNGIISLTMPNELNAEFFQSEISVMSAEAGSTVDGISAYIADKLQYNYDALDFLDRIKLSDAAMTAKGGVVTGRAICQGYANLFTLLAENVGIENIKVRGFAEFGYHVMNVVRIDGQIFAVDTTFYDTSDGCACWIMLDWETYCSLAHFTPVIDLETAFAMKYGEC